MDAPELKERLRALDEAEHVCPWCGNACDVDADSSPFCTHLHKAFFADYMATFGPKEGA